MVMKEHEAGPTTQIHDLDKAHVRLNLTRVVSHTIYLAFGLVIRIPSSIWATHCVVQT